MRSGALWHGMDETTKGGILVYVFQGMATNANALDDVVVICCRISNAQLNSMPVSSQVSTQLNSLLNAFLFSFLFFSIQNQIQQGFSICLN